jgi:hypothetical protein
VSGRAIRPPSCLVHFLSGMLNPFFRKRGQKTAIRVASSEHCNHSHQTQPLRYTVQPREMSSTHAPTITYRPPEWVTHATLVDGSGYEGQTITLDQRDTDYPLFAKNIYELDIASSHGFRGNSRRKFQTGPKSGQFKIPPLETPRTWNSLTFKLGPFKPSLAQARSSIVGDDGVISLTRRGKAGAKDWTVGSHTGTIVGGTAIRDGQIEAVSGDPIGRQFRVNVSVRFSGSYAEGGTDSVVGRTIDPQSPERWYTRLHEVGDFDSDPIDGEPNVVGNGNNVVDDDRDMVDRDEDMRTMVHQLVDTSILD